jgi:hypothetical protein
VTAATTTGSTTFLAKTQQFQANLEVRIQATINVDVPARVALVPLQPTSENQHLEELLVVGISKTVGNVENVTDKAQNKVAVAQMMLLRQLFSERRVIRLNKYQSFHCAVVENVGKSLKAYLG